MVFFRMIQDRFRTFRISGGRFYLHKSTLPFIPHDKIYFQPGILVEIIQLAPHFCKNIRYQVFKGSSFISIKVSLQINGLWPTVFFHSAILCSIFLASMTTPPFYYSVYSILGRINFFQGLYSLLKIFFQGLL